MWFSVINSIKCEKQRKDGHGDFCTPEKTQITHAQLENHPKYPFQFIFQVFKLVTVFNGIREATYLPKRYTIALILKK